MPINLDKPIDFLILFIIFIKIIFICSALGHLYFSYYTDPASKKDDKEMVYWKERTEFIFILSMSILLIYHFKPGKNKPVDNETSFLFFMFGWVLIITAKWKLFFKEAPWFKRLVKLIK